MIAIDNQERCYSKPTRENGQIRLCIFYTMVLTHPSLNILTFQGVGDTLKLQASINLRQVHCTGTILLVLYIVITRRMHGIIYQVAIFSIHTLHIQLHLSKKDNIERIETSTPSLLVIIGSTNLFRYLNMFFDKWISFLERIPAHITGLNKDDLS